MLAAHRLWDREKDGGEPAGNVETGYSRDSSRLI